jgi:hypothetical protein
MSYIAVQRLAVDLGYAVFAAAHPVVWDDVDINPVSAALSSGLFDF